LVPLLNSLDVEGTQSDHVLEQKTKKGRLAGFGQVLFRGASFAKVVQEVNIPLLIKCQVSLQKICHFVEFLQDLASILRVVKGILRVFGSLLPVFGCIRVDVGCIQGNFARDKDGGENPKIFIGPSADPFNLRILYKSQQLSKVAVGRGRRDVGCATWCGRRGVGNAT
jgi:hypothetical protein